MFCTDKPAMRTNIPAAAPVLGKDGSRGADWGRSSVQFTLMKWDLIYIIYAYKYMCLYNLNYGFRWIKKFILWSLNVQRNFLLNFANFRLCAMNFMKIQKYTLFTTLPKSFPSREYWQVKYGIENPTRPSQSRRWHGQAGSLRLSLRTGEHRNQLVVPGKLPNTEHKWGGDWRHEANREKARTDVEMELHLTKQSPCTSESILQTSIISCHTSRTLPYHEIIWVPQQEQNPGLSALLLNTNYFV